MEVGWLTAPCGYVTTNESTVDNDEEDEDEDEDNGNEDGKDEDEGDGDEENNGGYWDVHFTVDDVMGVGEDPVGEDGSGKVTVQSGWVMEDCLHHMETFSILNAGPLLEEARVKAIMTEKELRVPRRWTRSLGRGGLDTQRGAKARRPGQRGAKARRPGQRGAKARRPGQRGAKARRPGQRGAKARRPGQRGAKTAHTAESAERDALQAVDGSR
eukprot:jgi/Tetstr1/424802/TSEL_015305.t1